MDKMLSNFPDDDSEDAPRRLQKDGDDLTKARGIDFTPGISKRFAMRHQAGNAIGRRSILWIAFIAIGMWVVTATAATLKLTSSTDSTFQQRLDSLFPGVSSLPNYSQLQPFLLIVDNPSDDTVSAYSIEWEVTTRGGGHHEYSINYVSVHLSAVTSATIRPHQTRLISPWLNNDERDYKGFLLGMATFPPVFFPDPDERPFTVVAQVDSEVVNESQFTGANRHELLEQYQAKRAAQYREGLIMQEAISRGAKAEELRKILHDQVELAQHRSEVHSLETGRIALAEEAYRMLSLLSSDSTDEVRIRAEKLVQRRPPSLRVITPGKTVQ